MALYHSFTAQDGCVCLSDARDTKPSSSECPDMTFPVTLLVRSHCLAPCGTRNLQFFSQHTSACISETTSGTYPVFAYSVALFQCFRIIPVVQLRGGKQNILRKTAPLLRKARSNRPYKTTSVGQAVSACNLRRGM